MKSVKESVGHFSWTHKTPLRSGTDTVGHAPVTDGAEEKIQTRTITLAHFMHGISEVFPSSSASSHSELYCWHDRFGRKRTLNDSGLADEQ